MIHLYSETRYLTSVQETHNWANTANTKKSTHKQQKHNKTTPTWTGLILVFICACLETTTALKIADLCLECGDGSGLLNLWNLKNQYSRQDSTFANRSSAQEIANCKWCLCSINITWKGHNTTLVTLVTLFKSEMSEEFWSSPHTLPVGVPANPCEQNRVYFGAGNLQRRVDRSFIKEKNHHNQIGKRRMFIMNNSTKRWDSRALYSVLYLQKDILCTIYVLKQPMFLSSNTVSIWFPLDFMQQQQQQFLALHRCFSLWQRKRSQTSDNYFTAGQCEGPLTNMTTSGDDVLKFEGEKKKNT